jgi:hypothetical protein
MDIRELLQQLRDKGWGDSDIGDALGVARVTVYRWRQGQRPENTVMLSHSLRRLLRRAGPPRRKGSAGAGPAELRSLR